MTDSPTHDHAPGSRRGGLLDRLLRHATVTEVEQLRPRIRRVRLGGPEVGALTWRPGQQIRIRVDDAGLLSSLVRGKARDQLRTYSIVAADPAGGWLDLYVYQRSDEPAPGLSWARSIDVGAPVAFLGPEGRFVVQRPAAYHVFAGEETAQMAFAAMLSAAPREERVFGALEVAGTDEQLGLHRGDELSWLYRGSASAANSAGLLHAVRDLDLPPEPGIAYLAGEARTIVAIRRHLINDRGWPRRAILTKPFWTPGRRGLD